MKYRIWWCRFASNLVFHNTIICCLIMSIICLIMYLMTYLWAALEMDPNKDIVCQLCGAWFETRKGLSSHARAHLRHFGLECSESKGSPIDLLNQLIDSDNFKKKSSTLQPESPPEAPGLSNTVFFSKQSSLLSPPSSSSSSFSSLLYKVTALEGRSTSKPTSSPAFSLPGPPAKRHKSSCMRVFHLSSGDAMALPHSKYLFHTTDCAELLGVFLFCFHYYFFAAY